MSSNQQRETFVETLLATRRSSASPWLTWYSHSGERIELSGRVFDNWVAKSANLLGDLYDLDEQSVVVVDLDAHWKSLVLALAALHHGATLVDANHQEARGATLWITAAPNDENIPASSEILAVNPAALALSFGSDLGPVAEDFNATVRSYADQFYPSPVAAQTLALATGAGLAVGIQELFDKVAEPKGTILVRADQPVLALLPYLVGQWKAGDAVVLVEDNFQVTERLRDGERITFDYNAGN
ncbi:TIGR03089 family protein [Glutamicibacter sp. JC586]|uniref:TIGR03089 family protein n=1 Tax=Glutamicibacter sp. JC586 TaxID=2590552 RepID=UPI001359E3CB|nr:TIGR03089 family protein [Glutamicibacter sp. JC586]